MEALLRVEHLKKQFHRNSDGTYVLKDISFEMMPGECLGLIGNSGSGKSTIVKILTGITTATKGCIYLEGKQISGKRTQKEIGQDIFVNLHDANNKDSFVKGVITRIDKDLVGVKFKELTCDERKNIVSIYADNLKAYHDTKKVQKYIIEKKTVDIPEIETTISKG